VTTIRIRAATIDDISFVTSLVPRLTEFGVPPWRDAAAMNETDTRILTRKLAGEDEGTAIFVAEDDERGALGFIHLQQGADYYNKRAFGHISDVIVAPHAQGTGVALALMEKAEAWSRERGYTWITLSVFAQNTHAREVYERLGYGADIMKYVKELQDENAP